MEREKKQFQWDGGILLFGVALTAFFLYLGHAPLRDTESVGGEVIRTMLQQEEYRYAMVNGRVLTELPLPAYYLQLLPAKILGECSEFSLRLASVFAALVALVATVGIGKQLFSRNVGVMAGWILLGSYGFLEWGRQGNPAIFSVTTLALALWIALRWRRRGGFFAYFFYYVVLLSGILLSGWMTLPITLLATLPFFWGPSALKRHFNLEHAGALVASLLLFAAPLVEFTAMAAGIKDYFLSSGTPVAGDVGSVSVSLSTLGDKILQYWKNCIDYDKPLYRYFCDLPRVMLPWTAIFVAAVLVPLARYRKLERNHRTLLIMFFMAFAVASLPGARRWDYMLPLAVPGALLTARYWNERKDLWEDILFFLHRALLIMLGSLGVVSVIVIPLWPRLLNLEIPGLLLWGGPLCGVILLGMMVWDEQNHNRSELETGAGKGLLSGLTGIAGRNAGLLVGMTVLSIMVFSVMAPGMSEYCTTKSFVQEAGRMHPGIATGKIPVVIWNERQSAELTFYLNSPSPAIFVQSWMRKNMAWQQALADTPAFALFFRERDRKAIRSALLLESEKRSTLGGVMVPELQEQEFQFESAHARREKYRMLLIEKKALTLPAAGVEAAGENVNLEKGSGEK